MKTETLRADEYDSDSSQFSSFFTAVMKCIFLGVPAVIIFRNEITRRLSACLHNSDYIHTLLLPVFIGLLLILRRDRFKGPIRSGSILGFLFILFGVLMYALSTWPFSFGLARQYALLPVLAGIIMVSFGRRFLALSLPLFVLVLLAIPLGNRFYAKLIIRPETATINTTSKLINSLGGIQSQTEGNDLEFRYHNREGVVGLGESNRGARLFFVYASIGIFVFYSEKRTFLRWIIMAIVFGPLVLLCNFLRFFCWSLITLYGGFPPEASSPKYLSTMLSIVFCYLLFVLFSSIRLKLFVEANPKESSKDVSHANSNS